MEAINDKSSANIIVSKDRWKAFPLSRKSLIEEWKGIKQECINLSAY